MDEFTALIIGGMLISGLIGGAIGSSKGRGGAGFVLGLLLGFIGWIIVAVLDPTPEKMAENQALVSAIQGGSGGSALSREPQWGVDPFGRHDHRLFKGGAWTDRVADGGQQSTNQPVYPVPGEETEGWAPDPFGRFAQRFYKGGEWTSHVASDGTTYSDPPHYPPPPTSPPPAPPL